MADTKGKRKNPKKLSKKRIIQFAETLDAKSGVEILEKVGKVVETNFEKPLRLQDDSQVKLMWEATRRDARVASACKGLFSCLLSSFREVKGSDRLPKLLCKWVIVNGEIINNSDHPLTRCVRELCVTSVSEEFNSVATAFSKKLTTCIVTAVKDVFWGYIYSEKVSEEEVEQVQSQGSQSRQESVGKEDLTSLYRLGSSALFRMKKITWKKLKFKPRKVVTKALQASLRVVEALEESDRNKIPSSVNHQNRNLLVMKKELVPPLQEFTQAFGEVINFRGYKTYGRNLFKVAERQVLCNVDVKNQLFHCITKAGVEEKRTVVNSFVKEFMRKIFNIKCKAFLKSLEILEEENQGKSLQRETLLRAKLKVCGLDKKKAKK